MSNNGDMEPPRKKHKGSRTVSDIPHGHIEIPDICWKFIDTPQFQRLKNIKQLGTCDYVYPCATHDRKQHSLGVCYLAGTFLRKLNRNSPDAHVTEDEIVLVQIAALCHDLGHGPLSHTFDGIYIPLMKPGIKWRHEIASVAMFRRLLEANPRVFKSFKGRFPNERDKIFVEEALSGIPQGDGNWPYLGRGPEKAFLYDVVSNCRCGMDVDRFDYLMRDSHYLKINSSFDVQHLMENTGVLKETISGVTRKVVAFRKKVDTGIKAVGLTRQMLHEIAYQHKTNKAIEIMIVDALRLCDELLTYKGRNGQKLVLSETIHDMVAFEKVNDAVIDRIRLLADNYERNENVQQAAEILDNIARRELYPLISQCCRNHERNAKKDDSHQNNDETIEKDLLNLLKNSSSLVNSICSVVEKVDGNNDVTVEQLKENLIASVADIHQGMKSEDPVSKCLFFVKPQPDVALKLHTEDTKSRVIIVRLFSRTFDENVRKTAAACFSQWCKENKFVEFEESPSRSDPPTPPPSPGLSQN